MLKKLYFLIMALMLFAFTARAQVTNSSISGKVTANKEKVVGAVVVATHTPSGTVYRGVTNSNGNYTIQGMRVGGPYTVKVSYVGYKEQIFNNVYISLGEPSVIPVAMEEDSHLLDEITVSGSARKTHSGAATNFNQSAIENAPTVDRNIYDVAKLSPLVNTSKLGGVSIAGSNNRYNSFQIDGMVSNDVFGLAGTGTNGGQTDANPISMDAIEEIQIVASPFDVTQGGFTGGGINAITKSGTNEFKGSAYGYYTDENFYGRYNQVSEANEKLTSEAIRTLGATFGGPIIKDKLFFFVSAEYKNSESPSSYYPGYSSNYITEAEADRIIAAYKKFTGFEDNYSRKDLKKKTFSLLGRVDWNINDENKFSFRYQLNDSYKDVLGSSSSIFYFSNSGNRIIDKTNSFVAELNSNISDKLYNEARVGVTFVRDNFDVAYQGPSASISNLGANSNITAYIGTEYSSGVNRLKQNIFTIEDNLSLYTGDHTITFGTHNEFYNMKNLFIQSSNGAYYFSATYDENGNVTSSALENFENGNAYQFVCNYSDVDITGTTQWAGTIKAGQFGFYVQDKWSVNPNLSLTYGLRLDIPLSFNSPSVNEEFNSSEYATKFGVRVGDTPSAKLMFSPRVGFRWFMDDSHKSLIRGGIGMFTGRVPFVWLSNLWNNTGVELKGTTISSNVPNIGTYGNDAMAAAKSSPGSYRPTINTADKDFKYPQVLRANLAWEYTLPYGVNLTLEGLYSKTLNNVWFENLAIENNGKKVYMVNSSFPQASTTYFDRNNGGYYAIINLKNTNKGYSYSLSGKLEKSFDFGLDVMASYTFGHTYGVIDGTSSVAYSNWKYNYSVDPTNKDEVSKTIFDVPHRVVAQASYTSPRYGHGRWATNVTLTYNGYTGQRYSITMNESVDLNGDSQRGNTLLYIPTEAELAAMSFDSEENRRKFETWIQNDSYAKNHRGQFAERNSNHAPWENHFDLHLAQSFYYLKERGSKIELTFDILNVANLLNKNWGTYYSSAYNHTILRVSSLTKDSEGNVTPTYSWSGDSPSKDNVESRWHAQIGLRVTF